MSLFYFRKPHWHVGDCIHMFKSAGTPQLCGTLGNFTFLQGRARGALYLGMKSWENASELRGEPESQLLREPDPGHVVRPHLKHPLIQYTENLNKEGIKKKNTASVLTSAR